ncbi:MAG: Holliday junction resolvase RuvX [Planctomycetota bacterium]
MADVLLALDYGRRKIGLAVSTGLGTIHPRPRLDRRAPDDDLAALCALAAEVGARALVIGLPHHMDGSRSEIEVEVRDFARALADRSGLPVFGVDERLTTEEAEAVLRQAEADPRRRRARRDSAAACLILRDYLEGRGAPERLQ